MQQMSPGKYTLPKETWDAYVEEQRRVMIGYDPGHSSSAVVVHAPVPDDIESDDELRARVWYVAGKEPLPGGAKLEEIAGRYGLSRRKREISSRATQPIALREFDDREVYKREYLGRWSKP